MSAMNKTAIEEANRQLTGMYQQMVDQERRYKEELHEKEQEIVRLHTLLQQTEERLLTRALNAEAEVSKLREAAVSADAALAQIAAIATNSTSSDGRNGVAPLLPQPSSHPLITPPKMKLVTLPSTEK
eukprot:m.31607 g.31607  ORF g.31607 m.31607 type:complete len:128 (-) comp4816_c0_seq1:159-542(-)